MKYAIVILGGAADEPQPELDGRTPLEHAELPVLRGLCEAGRLGRVRFLPDDAKPPLPPGAATAMFALLGYDPGRRYPGHAPLSALGLRLPVQPGDWVFNLSLLSVLDGVVQPASAVSVPPEEARELLTALLGPLGLSGCTLHPAQATGPGVQPAHLLVMPADHPGRSAWSEAVAHRPEDIAGLPLKKAMPVGGAAGERLQQWVTQSQAVLAEHPLNRARAEMGEPLVTHLWPWGQGTLDPQPAAARQIRPWPEKFGRSAILLATDPAVCGVALRAGIETELVAHDPSHDAGNATLGERAAQAIAEHDIVIVYTDAPRAASLSAGPADKARAIELAEQHLLKPVHYALSAQPGPHRLLVTPLHTAALRTQRETPGPVPFLVAGEKITTVVPRPFTEPAAEHADLQVAFGHELMEFFLRGGVR
jgi:2,3-bisphosphoglycerate-independent phosphoglycerate mutase